MVGFCKLIGKNRLSLYVVLCLFDSRTQKVFVNGTVVDFINLKNILQRYCTTSICEPLTTERTQIFLDWYSSQHNPANRNSTVNKTI
jgi:hypothetical protein